MSMKTKTLEETDFYRTNDLALAGAISLWYPLAAIDKENPSKVVWIFEKDQLLLGLLEQYWRNELKVEPQAYFYQIKKLKNQIYNSA